MSDKLLEQYIRTQTAIRHFADDMRERVREQSGQTTVEWLVIMVGLIALAGVLAGADLWNGVGKSLTKAFADLIDKIVGKAK
jgi:Flp pilus assembly pilin Flp